jgi:hypothetical protein
LERGMTDQHDNFTPYEPSYTIDEFCAVERISRVKLYEAWKQNFGPRFYWNGNQRRITHRSRLAWQDQREAAAAGDQEAA